jgi:DNA repair protein RadC
MRYKISSPLMLDVKEIPQFEQPRERLKSNGVEALTDEELITLLISSGTKENGIKNITNSVINILDS